jgi:Protein of unknown function, DUF481
MKKHASIVVLAITILVSIQAPVSLADTLRLDRDDTLHGNLIEISDGIVVFRTELAGQLIIPLRRAREITTVLPFEIELADGRALLGRLEYDRAGGHSCSEVGGEDRPVTLADIAVMRPLATKPQGNTPAALHTESTLPLDGTWATGFLQRWGNLNYGAPFAKLTLLHESERFHFHSTAMFEAADEDSFPRLFRLANQWHFQPEQRNRPFLGVSLERDTDAALDLRADMAVGVERRFIAREFHSFEGDVGLNVSSEYYDRESLWRESGPTFDDTLRELQGAILLNQLLNSARGGGSGDSARDFGRFAAFSYYAEEDRRVQEQDLSFRLRLHYRRIFPKGSSIAEELQIFPSLSNPGALRARSESSIQVHLAPRLNLKLNLLVDYDDEPVFSELDQWRTSVGASIVLDF